jgi:DNA-binding MarR family transcriptional regulator
MRKDLFDEDLKRLLAATLELSLLMRRQLPSSPAADAGLALGQAMRRHGLGARHVSALLSIALRGPLTVTELARRHQVMVKTASLVAVELEQAGLIDRRHDPADRRRTILAIAREKEGVVAAGVKRRAAQLRRTLDSLTPVERRGLIKGLELLVQSMVEPASHPPKATDSSSFRV